MIYLYFFKVFPSNYSSEHIECSFDNLADNVSLKLHSFCSKSEKKDLFFFKIFASNCSSRHGENNIENLGKRKYEFLEKSFWLKMSIWTSKNHFCKRQPNHRVFFTQN